jgi:hypothetical protein
MTSVIAIILAVLGIVKTLVDKGILSKKAGSGAVMAADAAVAVLDTRELVQDFINAFVDALKVDNPQLADTIQQKANPILRAARQKVDEYRPKVDKFGQIANRIGQKGENTTEGIKDDEQLKDTIPDSIVPT